MVFCKNVVVVYIEDLKNKAYSGFENLYAMLIHAQSFFVILICI